MLFWIGHFFGRCHFWEVETAKLIRIKRFTLQQRIEINYKNAESLVETVRKSRIFFSRLEASFLDRNKEFGEIIRAVGRSWWCEE